MINFCRSLPRAREFHRRGAAFAESSGAVGRFGRPLDQTLFGRMGESESIERLDVLLGKCIKRQIDDEDWKIVNLLVFSRYLIPGRNLNIKNGLKSKN